MSDARLILTCGLPGVGKTTLARQLALERRAVRLTKDEWLWALGSTPWDASTQQKMENELWQLAQEILRLGLSVVLDFGLWARIERDEIRSVARGLGVGVELHYLEVPADELWRRIDARNSQPTWASHPIRHSDLDEWVRCARCDRGGNVRPSPGPKLTADNTLLPIRTLLPRCGTRRSDIAFASARSEGPTKRCRRDPVSCQMKSLSCCWRAFCSGPRLYTAS